MKRLLLSTALLFALSACSDDSDPKPQPDGSTPDQTVQTDTQTQQDGQVTPDTQQTFDKVEDAIPGDNFVDGWTASGAVEAGYDNTAIEALINGAHEPYNAKGCAGYARRSYENGDLTMNLQVWEMNAAQSALEMYDYEKTQSGLTFEDITGVVDAAVIGKEGMARFWAYGHTGVYVYKMDGNATAENNVETVKTAVTEFITKFAALLPQS